MPYRVRGSNLEHFTSGRWSVKQRCGSHDNAVKAMQLLQMKEHGKIPERPGTELKRAAAGGGTFEAHKRMLLRSLEQHVK